MSKRKTAEIRLCEIVNELGLDVVESLVRLLRANDKVGVKFVAISHMNPALENTKLQSKPIDNKTN